MQAVFSIAPDETTVAMNHPQTQVFVAKVLEESKTLAGIEENFLDEMGDPAVANQIQQVAGLDWRMVQQRWLNQLEKEFDLVWVQPELQYRNN